MSGEFDFIAALRARLSAGHAPNAGLLVPPGDDAAELAVGGGAGGRVVFAADMLLDGVHFEIARCGARAAGRKALAVNLSDMAAMAARPTAVVVSLAVPRGGAGEGAGREIADEAMRGIEELAAAYDVAIAGGDTNSWRGPFAVNVAIIGEPHRRGSVTRAGARVGDVIMVTGPLGGSIHGRHLSFQPRVREAQTLHEMFGLSAMIDLSDGLGSDLRHVLEASGCGAVLRRSAVPVHADVGLYGEDGGDPIVHALGDGEDFELCFTVGAAEAERIERGEGGVRAVAVGKVVEGDGMKWEDGEEVGVLGFVHGL